MNHFCFLKWGPTPYSLGITLKLTGSLINLVVAGIEIEQVNEYPKRFCFLKSQTHAVNDSVNDYDFWCLMVDILR